MDTNCFEGLWRATLKMEDTASIVLQEMLKPYEQVVEDLYECGVTVATLNSKRKVDSHEDLIVAALFLKRCLNDFRAVWRLLNIGYTSQAACIAAATFEYALMISVVSGRVDRARIINELDETESPWKASELCQMEVDALREEAKINGERFSKADSKKAYKSLYSLYKWLCKIKHPTLL